MSENVSISVSPEIIDRLDWEGLKYTAIKVALELDIFNIVAKGHCTADEIAKAAECNKRGIQILLDALCPLEFLAKSGDRHPPTQYVAGRITSKNRQEFVKGRWTARLRVEESGQDGMFPAWWLLGARNNEPPVEEEDEDVCWPMTGSGEIDIFEHHSDGGPDHYAARAIKNLGYCGGGDWQQLMHVQEAGLADYHEYAVEWDGGDLLFLLDGQVIYRSEGQGDDFPEPLFAVLNFAKINAAPMTVAAWTMEVDWVMHERRAGN